MHLTFVFARNRHSLEIDVTFNGEHEMTDATPNPPIVPNVDPAIAQTHRDVRLAYAILTSIAHETPLLTLFWQQLAAAVVASEPQPLDGEVDTP